ncbi:hypothetical protein RHS01_10857 [Rhizoctonia solani]|uniref:Retrovirus-related Pol polyprotein from transposon TNT 1-94 n=1 Tax=Rhizoctonia solani TaxID=456999 RepID=A0A8H7LWU1_9AGAM|nr:hypothetical protein RHS01_10857 [Rhizoctonia solani]
MTTTALRGTVLSNPQFSTPDKSPLLSPSPSANAVEHLFDDNLPIDIATSFPLRSVALDVPLPDSSSDASFDTVAYDLNDRLFLSNSALLNIILRSNNSTSTKISYTRIQATISAVLTPEDRLYLLSFNRIEYPTPPPSTNQTKMAGETTANTGNTNTIIIADKNYSITKLQGQEDYQVWRIQMEDMFQDVDVMGIVSGDTLKPSDSNEATVWDKRNLAALGAICRRVNTGPMIHVARCSNASDAWKIFKNQYQSLGVAAMTMLRNRFTSLCMMEGNDLKAFIKELCKIFNDLNIALLAKSSSQLSKLDFIQQLLVALPELWQILVSVIPQRPKASNTNGTKLSIDIQSHLLAEYHCQKSINAKRAFFT